MSQSTLLTFFGKSKKPLATNEKRKTNPIGSEESAKAARKAFLDQLFGEDSEKEDMLIDESDDNLSQNSKDADVELENVDSNSKQGNEASIEKKGPTRKFRHEWVSKNPFLLHIVRNRVEFMKCAWCEKYKVKGPWGKGNGCKSIMKSAIRKHKKSREHAWAAARFHHEGGKHLKEHAKVVLNRNMHKVITCMKLAYFNAKEDLAIRKYEKLCELAYVLELTSMPVKHEYGTYTNMMAGKEFIFSISQYLENIQKTEILHSPFYGLMVDETTDKGLEKHLIIYVSFLALEGKGTCTTQFARLLAVPDGCAQTKFDAIMKFLDERGLDKQRMVGIATDGDSSMLGCHDGLVAKLRREVPHLTSIHCIAHREALAVVDAAKSFACLSYIDKIANKIYSWISASSLRHSEFQKLLQEMNLQILEVLQIFDVRWLSRGNVMERLTQLMPAILSFWRTSAPSWYDKLRVYKVLFCIYMLADVLKELNKLSIVFQKDTLDISSISSSIENVLSGLRRKFLGEHFHKDTVYLKKFMESTNDGVLRHVNDSGEEYAHVLLYTSIPGKDKSGIPLDLDMGDVASCVNLARMFVQKVIECVNERFPDVYFFNAARLFCPRHYPRNAKFSHSSKEREEKVTSWLERLLVKFGCNLIDQQACKEELFSFTDALYYECGKMGMIDAWQVFCSESDWHRTYANMMKLWQIMLVLPVSSVSCERGFSKQNLIKVDSRQCLNVSTLEALMRISLLGPSPESINWEQVHEIWKLVKSRRVCDL